MTPAADGKIFPATRPSVLEAVAGDDPAARERALELLTAAYWRPAYLHLRLKWCHDRESAEDLTQDFFLRSLDGAFFARFDSTRGRFRSYVRAALDHLAANVRRDEARLKRGGGAAHLPLDFAGAEDALQYSPSSDPDQLFHREWIRSLFSLAVEALQAQCAEPALMQRFAIFRRCDLEPENPAERPSYRHLATEFDLPVTQITNHLAWARREFRRLVLERLRAMSGSEAEFRAEARELFGVDPA